MPQFILLLHEAPGGFPAGIGPDQIQAIIQRRLGSRHLSVAEDAVQDALITALQQWPFRGVPEQPEAWLFQVAKNRALDRLRHARMAAEKAPAVALERPAFMAPAATQALLRDELPPVEDDQLGLLFLTTVARGRRRRSGRRLLPRGARPCTLDTRAQLARLTARPKLGCVRCVQFLRCVQCTSANSAVPLALGTKAPYAL